MHSIFRTFSSGCAAACILTSSAGAETYTPFDTGPMSENFTTLTGDSQWYVLYCIDVGTLAQNDILVATAESQLEKSSATTHTNVERSAQIARTSTSCDQINANTNFLYPGGVGLDGTNGYNVTPTEYRGVSPKVATATINAHLDYHYVTYNVKASDFLAVEQGYGRLQVLKIHPDSP
jgi:hypothetical protein